jgi:hypothetical protein
MSLASVRNLVLLGGGVAPVAAPIDYPARYGAVAHYALDEASGNAIATLGGLDLTAVNAPGATTGKVSGARAISSSGTKCFTRADDVLFRQGSYDFALGFWVNPTTVGADQALISKDGSTTGWHTRFTSANKILFISRQAGGADYGRVTSTTALSASTWSYVLLGVDFASALVFVSINAGAFDTAVGTGTPGPGTANFELGRNPSAGETVFTGALDEVTIFKPTGIASLRAEMASRLYNGGAGLAYPWA